MAAIREAIVQDTEYIKLMEAVAKGCHPKTLDKYHPTRKWLPVGYWLSMLELSGTIILNRERILLPKSMQLSTVTKLHDKTHGTTEHMQDTLKQVYMWTDWKQDFKMIKIVWL